MGWIPSYIPPLSNDWPFFVFIWLSHFYPFFVCAILYIILVYFCAFLFLCIHFVWRLDKVPLVTPLLKALNWWNSNNKLSNKTAGHISFTLTLTLTLTLIHFDVSSLGIDNYPYYHHSSLKSYFHS